MSSHQEHGTKIETYQRDNDTSKAGSGSNPSTNVDSNSLTKCQKRILRRGRKNRDRTRNRRFDTILFTKLPPGFTVADIQTVLDQCTGLNIKNSFFYTQMMSSGTEAMMSFLHKPHLFYAFHKLQLESIPFDVYRIDNPCQDFFKAGFESYMDSINAYERYNNIMSALFNCINTQSNKFQRVCSREEALEQFEQVKAKELAYVESILHYGEPMSADMIYNTMLKLSNTIGIKKTEDKNMDAAGNENYIRSENSNNCDNSYNIWEQNLDDSLEEGEIVEDPKAFSFNAAVEAEQLNADSEDSNDSTKTLIIKEEPLDFELMGAIEKESVDVNGKINEIIDNVTVKQEPVHVDSNFNDMNDNVRVKQEPVESNDNQTEVEDDFINNKVLNEILDDFDPKTIAMKEEPMEIPNDAHGETEPTTKITDNCINIKNQLRDINAKTNSYNKSAKEQIDVSDKSTSSFISSSKEGDNKCKEEKEEETKSVGSSSPLTENNKKSDKSESTNNQIDERTTNTKSDDSSTKNSKESAEGQMDTHKKSDKKELGTGQIWGKTTEASENKKNTKTAEPNRNISSEREVQNEETRKENTPNEAHHNANLQSLEIDETDKNHCKVVVVRNLPCKMNVNLLRYIKSTVLSNVFLNHVPQSDMTILILEDRVNGINKPRGEALFTLKTHKQALFACLSLNGRKVAKKYLDVRLDIGHKVYNAWAPKLFSVPSLKRKAEDSRCVEGKEEPTAKVSKTGEAQGTTDNSDSEPGRSFMPPEEISFSDYGFRREFLHNMGLRCPLSSSIIVEQIHPDVDEAKLYEVFSLAGDMKRVRYWRSEHKAWIEYDHPVEAVQAIAMFRNQKLFDQPFTITMDTSFEKRPLPRGLSGINRGLGENGAIMRGVRANMETRQIQEILVEMGKLFKFTTREHTSPFHVVRYERPVMTDWGPANQPAAPPPAVTPPTPANFGNPIVLNAVSKSPSSQYSSRAQRRRQKRLMTKFINPDPVVIIPDVNMVPNFVNSVVNSASNIGLPPNNIPVNQNMGFGVPNLGIPPHVQNLNHPGGPGIEERPGDMGLPPTNPTVNQNMGFGVPNLGIPPHVQNLIHPGGPGIEERHGDMDLPPTNPTVNQNMGFGVPNLGIPPHVQNLNHPGGPGIEERGLPPPNPTVNQNMGFGVPNSGIPPHAQNLNHPGDPRLKERHVQQGIPPTNTIVNQNMGFGVPNRIPPQLQNPNHPGDTRFEERNANNGGSNRLIFNNLPPCVTEEALATKMREVGELSCCKLTNGSAIVSFSNPQDANRCFRLFNRSKVDGQVIEVINLGE